MEIKTRMVLEVTYAGTFVNASSEAERFAALLNETFAKTDPECAQVEVTARNGKRTVFMRGEYSPLEVQEQFQNHIGYEMSV